MGTDALRIEEDPLVTEETTEAAPRSTRQWPLRPAVALLIAMIAFGGLAGAHHVFFSRVQATTDEARDDGTIGLIAPSIYSTLGAGVQIEGRASYPGKQCYNHDACNTGFEWCGEDEFCYDLPCDASQSIGGKCPPCYHDCGAKCFAGEALVTVLGRGQVPIATIGSGDRVLVECGSGTLAYEPVLGFLHVVPGPADDILTVEHARGVFRASANHLLFVNGGDTAVENVRVGDQLRVASGDEIFASSVLAVRHSTSAAGMYAPLTPSGKIVVDDVVASNYAQADSSAPLPHAAVHAVLFPVRAFHALGLASVVLEKKSDEMHPYIDVLYRRLRMDVVYRSLVAS